MNVRRSISCLLIWAVLGVAKSASAAGEAHGSPPASDALDYAVADAALRVERLDSSSQESFLSVRVDPLGRVFVGGRESLFVYEPAANGGYLPKKLLFKFPPNSWVYDVEFRGNDLYVLTMSALYLVPDGVVQRTDLHPKRLAWGVPRGHVHQCFHALAWGPEGDLYISMGDPLWYYGDFERAELCPDRLCSRNLQHHIANHPEMQPYLYGTSDDSSHGHPVIHNGISKFHL